MKRFVAILAVEGYTTADNRRIEPGGIKLDKTVMVYRRDENFDRTPVGRIESIYRVGDVVVGKGWWTEPLEKYTPGEVLEIALDSVETDYTEEDIVLVMNSGQMYGAKVGTNPSFPQASIIFLEDE